MNNQEERGSGFLITCDKNKQKQAIKDAFNFLGEYIEDIYGDIETTLIHNQLTKQQKQINLQNQIHIRSTMKNKLRILNSVDTNVNCLIFIKINQSASGVKIQPTRIVAAMMKDIHQDNRELTRFCHKILPVERSFKAEHFKMLDTIDELFQARDNSEIKSWALNFKCRNNSKFNYKEVLKETEKIAKKYGHFVDIYYPQWTVAVEIVHHLMCLAIVEDYKQFEEFRLHPKGYKPQPLWADQPTEKAEKIREKKQHKRNVQNQKEGREDKEDQEDQAKNIERNEPNKEQASLPKQPNIQQSLSSPCPNNQQQQHHPEPQKNINQLLKQKIRVSQDEDIDFI